MAKTYSHAHEKVNRIDRKLDRNRRHDRAVQVSRLDSREMRQYRDYSVR